MLHCPVVKRVIVAVDGPSGAGKGTVARATARALDYTHVDTGAMYRAVAWRALALGIAVDQAERVAALAAAARLALDGGRTVIDGHDVTDAIRTPAIDMAAAAVARNPGVRAVLVERQRAMGQAGGVVMEGRDIGTVVFPDAALKLYVTASPRIRAQRRVAELGGDVDDIAVSIAERDRRDMERADGPLRTAEGATVVDTSELTVDEVVDQIVGLLA
jgi:cytidylate kinase